MIDLDELLSGDLQHDWASAPKRSLAAGASPDLDKATVLAESLAPSVSGHGGDDALFRAANELATVLHEDSDGIFSVLRDTFNKRCVPPWPEQKLQREAERAAQRQATPEARMARRRKKDDEVDPFRPAEAESPEDLGLDVTKFGTPRATQSNIGLVLDHVFGERIRYEECSGRLICKGIDESHGHLPDGEWSDAHTTAVMHVCESLRLYVSASQVDREVEHHGRKYAYNLLRDGLQAMAKTWDGKARIDRALVDYWGAPDTEATKITSRVFFLSLAARGLMPGQKVDTCPIFIGPQGIRKSSSFSALVGVEFFSDSPLPIGDKDAAQAIRGKLLWEFAEHVALSKREDRLVKQFLSQSVDRFRASYGRHMQDVPRTCTFVSTSNDEQVLTDPSGARRFLPVSVSRVDIEAIKRDRTQLLGEAAWRWSNGEQNARGERSEAGGEPHWLTPEEETLLNDVRKRATEIDVWQELIETWLVGRESFTLAELFDEHAGAIHMTEDRIGKADQMRAAGILRHIGWAQSRVGGKRVWVSGGKKAKGKRWRPKNDRPSS